MNYPSRIRIVSETGLVSDTHVFDTETGQELTPNAPITAIDISIEPGNSSAAIKAILYYALPALDLVTSAGWVETRNIHVDANDPESITAAIDRLTTILANLEGNACQSTTAKL